MTKINKARIGNLVPGTGAGVSNFELVVKDYIYFIRPALWLCISIYIFYIISNRLNKNCEPDTRSRGPDSTYISNFEFVESSFMVMRKHTDLLHF